MPSLLIRRLLLLAGSCALFASLCLSEAAQSPTGPSIPIQSNPDDLTGTWRADDGATYQIRQTGDVVWWVGLSADNGRTFTNVFQGRRVGETISGTWADVPNGQYAGTGSLELTAPRSSRGRLITKRGQAGNGFGATQWWKTQTRTAQQPVAAGGIATILEDGTVKITQPDGSARIYRESDTIVIAPDGSQSYLKNHNVQPATPPVTSLGTPNMKAWLEFHNQGLLDAIGRRLNSSEKDAMVNNMVQAENRKNLNLFQRADFRRGALFNLQQR